MSSSERLLVLGATGQLGTDLVKAAATAGVEHLGLSHEEVEVTRAESLAAAMERFHPTIVINSAAFHQVDRCEDDPHQAYLVNTVGALLVARAAAVVGDPCEPTVLAEVAQLPLDTVLPVLRRRGLLRRAEPEVTYRPHAAFTFSDPLVAGEWWRAAVGADAADPPGPGKPVTVVDNGVDLTHPEFTGRPNTIPSCTGAHNGGTNPVRSCSDMTMTVAAPPSMSSVTTISTRPPTP